MLSTLFAVKAELCNRKFELKVNDVRFVGHPTLLPYRTNKDDTAAMILINIVFALQASASHSIGKSFTIICVKYYLILCSNIVYLSVTNILSCSVLDTYINITPRLKVGIKPPSTKCL